MTEYQTVHLGCSGRAASQAFKAQSASAVTSGNAFVTRRQRRAIGKPLIDREIGTYLTPKALVAAHTVLRPQVASE